MHLPSWIGQLPGRAVGAMPTAAAVTAAAALVAVAAPAQAEIVYTPASIVIPDNIDGVYLNVVTGATGTSGGAVPGWDLNPYTASLLGNGFNLWGPTANTWLSTSGLIAGPYPLAAGTMIDSGGTFLRPAGGTDIGPQVTLGAANLFGFRFVNESLANQVQYGWIEVSFGGSIGDRTITGWAYDNTGAGIMAGVIPEPGTVALWLAGLVAVGGVAYRRRKAEAQAEAA